MNLNRIESEVGSVLVLAQELKQGYPYRLLIIGHLNEAAEESRQIYPHLADLIVAQRKKFQESNTLDLTTVVNEMQRIQSLKK